MYQTILITLDATATDRAIIDHVKLLAKQLGSTVVLMHVATGVPAVYHAAAAGQEIQQDHAYLSLVQTEFEEAGIHARTELAYGDPVKEIVKWVTEKHCDLVAMSTHGHKLIADLVQGTTASRVQHSISVPV